MLAFQVVVHLEVSLGLFPHSDDVEIILHPTREHADLFANVLSDDGKTGEGVVISNYTRLVIAFRPG